MISQPNSRPWPKSVTKAQDFSHDWENYIVIKVKNIRAIALSGLHPFMEGNFQVPQAIGFIELLGARIGALHTSLQIGFTLSQEIHPPSFQLHETLAMGGLVLHAASFAAILHCASSPTAHFRIGGDGTHNALATEAPLLQMPDKSAKT